MSQSHYIYIYIYIYKFVTIHLKCWFYYFLPELQRIYHGDKQQYELVFTLLSCIELSYLVHYFIKKLLHLVRKKHIKNCHCYAKKSVMDRKLPEKDGKENFDSLMQHEQKLLFNKNKYNRNKYNEKRNLLLCLF